MPVSIYRWKLVQRVSLALNFYVTCGCGCVCLIIKMNDKIKRIRQRKKKNRYQNTENGRSIECDRTKSIYIYTCSERLSVIFPIYLWNIFSLTASLFRCLLLSFFLLLFLLSYGYGPGRDGILNIWTLNFPRSVENTIASWQGWWWWYSKRFFK